MTEPIEIIIDSREQKPLDFRPFIESDGICFGDGSLHTGDYSIGGFEQCVAIERKSLDDLVGTLINGYEADTRRPPKRFNRELLRMSFFDRAIILVEATEADLWSHRYRSMAQPASVWGMLMGIFATYGVSFYFTGNRLHSAKWIVDFAKHYVNARTKKYFLPEDKPAKPSGDDF